MSQPISYAMVDKSTFIDFTGYRVTAAATAEAAYGITDGRLFNHTDGGFNVALVLPRVADPTTLLNGDWASRQAALDALGSAVWSRPTAPARTSSTAPWISSGTNSTSRCWIPATATT